MNYELRLDGDNTIHLFYECVLCGLQNRDPKEFTFDCEEFVHKDCFIEFTIEYN